MTDQTKPVSTRTEGEIIAFITHFAVAFADRQQDVQTGPGEAAQIREAIASGSALRVVVEVPRGETGVRPTVELVVVDEYGGEQPLRRVTLNPAYTRQVAPGRPAPETMQ